MGLEQTLLGACPSLPIRSLGLLQTQTSKKKKNGKKRTTRRKKAKNDSESDNSEDEESEDDSRSKKKKKGSKKKKKVSKKKQKPKGKAKKPTTGRKKLRGMLSEDKLDEKTVQAQDLEKQRLARLAAVTATGGVPCTREEGDNVRNVRTRGEMVLRQV